MLLMVLWPLAKLTTGEEKQKGKHDEGSISKKKTYYIEKKKDIDISQRSKTVKYVIVIGKANIVAPHKTIFLYPIFVNMFCLSNTL